MSKESQAFSKAHSPLPASNTAILDNKTLLEYSKSIPIKKTSSTSDRLSRYRQYFSAEKSVNAYIQLYQKRNA